MDRATGRWQGSKFLGERVGTRQGSFLDTLEHSRKQFLRGNTEDDLIGKRGLEGGLAPEAFVARNTGASLGSDERCHVILGEPAAFAMRAEVVLQFPRGHEG